MTVPHERDNPAAPRPVAPVLLHPIPERAPLSSRAALPPPKRHWLCRWLRAHWFSLLIVAGLLLVVGLVHAIGYDRFPGRATDDEGTYVSQAWAVQHWRSLAHYTYWYDHPPVGWITMAAYNWVTRAFERLPTSVTVGREFMIWVKLVSAVMVYLLGRRLGCRPWPEGAASSSLSVPWSPACSPSARFGIGASVRQ